MPIDAVGSGTNLYNEMLQMQTDAVANNSEMSMDDFWKLLAAQLQYQDMTNPMSNSEMMNQMTQMATMNAMTNVSNAVANFAVVTNNLSQVTLTAYSTGLIGKEVTVATLNEEGKVVGEIKGVVSGVDLTGAQSVYVDGKKYSLSQIMSVGNIKGAEDTTDKDSTDKVEGDTDKDSTDKIEGDTDKDSTDKIEEDTVKEPDNGTGSDSE